MQLPPSYVTRQCDGITLLQRATFKDAYKVLFLSRLPSKTREMVFQKLFGQDMDLLGRSMILSISQHTADCITNLVLTLLEIVFNKPHPSILLPIKDATSRKVLTFLHQETKCDIIFRWAQLQILRRREKLHPRIQAHLVSVVNKIIALLEYQGVLHYSNSLSLLLRIIQVALHAHS
jgi:hypothetical protein